MILVAKPDTLDAGSPSVRIVIEDDRFCCAAESHTSAAECPDVHHVVGKGKAKLLIGAVKLTGLHKLA